MVIARSFVASDLLKKGGDRQQEARREQEGRKGGDHQRQGEGE